MGRSRLQAICNMTWGACYATALHPTNESAEVSADQPAHTDPPLLLRARGEELGTNPPPPPGLGEGKQSAVDAVDPFLTYI